MAPLPGILGLEIVRLYRQTHPAEPTPRPHVFSAPWRWSYDYTLVPTPDRQEQVLTHPDGTQTRFRPPPSTSPSPQRRTTESTGYLEPSTTERQAWVWVAPTGFRYQFSALGDLLSIQAPTGERTELIRDPEGVLLQVLDPQGRRLLLSKVSVNKATTPWLRHLDTPLGRFGYEHADVAASRDVLLTRVDLPTHHEPQRLAHAHANRIASHSNLSRIYHHDDPDHPTALTGITLQGTDTTGRDVSERLLDLPGWHEPSDINGRALTMSKEPFPLSWSAGARQPATLRLPGGKIVGLTWDAGTGWLTGLRSAEGQRITFMQDARQQLRRLAFQTRPDGVVRTLELSYDVHGRRLPPPSGWPVAASSTTHGPCAPPASSPLPLVTGSETQREYDEAGRLRRRSLPDGSWLEYQRDAHGQVVGLAHQRLLTPWLHWAIPAQVLLRDIRHDLWADHLSAKTRPQAEQNPDGMLTRQYAVLAGVALAVLETPEGRSSAPGPTSSWRANGVALWRDLMSLTRYWLGGRHALTWQSLPPAQSHHAVETVCASLASTTDLPWAVQALMILSRWADVTFADPSGRIPAEHAGQVWRQWWPMVYALTRGVGTPDITADMVGHDAPWPVQVRLSTSAGAP